MYSYFEYVFKCAFLKSVVHTHKEIAESLSFISDKDVTAVQHNGKQIHSDMDEPNGRYAKTIVLLLLHPSS